VGIDDTSLDGLEFGKIEWNGGTGYIHKEHKAVQQCSCPIYWAMCLINQAPTKIWGEEQPETHKILGRILNIRYTDRGALNHSLGEITKPLVFTF